MLTFCMRKKRIEQIISLYVLTSREEDGIEHIVYNEQGREFKIPIPTKACDLVVSVNLLSKSCFVDYAFRDECKNVLGHSSEMYSNCDVVISFLKFCDRYFARIN